MTMSPNAWTRAVTPLPLALGKNTTTLQFVVDELHVDINAPNLQGRTPLHEAVTHNYVECCQLLLDHGGDDTLQSATLSTPFHTAAACGSVDCMEVLLRHSEEPAAKVNELDKNHSSALHKCAFDGDVRVSRWLVEHGATVDTVDKQSLTPLLVAVKMGQKNVVEYLLSQGANSNQVDDHGNCGAHFCAMRCDTTILNLLLKAGATVKVQNSDFNNPLHLAAIHQRPDSKEWEELVADLLTAGCDPDQENASRKKPADYLNRGLKSLFSREEVQRRRAIEEESQRQLEKNIRDAEALRASWAAKITCEMEDAKRRDIEEGELLSWEAEDRRRADEDARTKMEAVLEMVRVKEEEVEKLKVLVEKAESKAAK
ncbi:ankyrin [Strigomonas culicis]|uniref:Ankyrin n=1 Tax=Strigomonas culicis TaxID=28005 RepID=S9UX95_9TRYP|nr:ankyrin [Strigomonas culicis]|eukprot:EPY19101.1 ankyrin [Strigomonas culicis]